MAAGAGPSPPTLPAGPLAAKNPRELEKHLRALRRARAHGEILRLARRSIERGKGADTIRRFALEEIEKSKAASAAGTVAGLGMQTS